MTISSSAPVTGGGTVSSRPTTLGSRARTTTMIPAVSPTVRAATPVKLISAIDVGR